MKPIAAWRRGAKSTARTRFQSLRALYQRNPRRYGGYLVHLGITIIGIGVIGSTLFQQETQQTLAVGQSLDIGGYTLRYDALDSGQIADDGRMMDIAERDGDARRAGTGPPAPAP